MIKLKKNPKHNWMLELMITLIFSIHPKPLLALFSVLTDMYIKHISYSRALVKAIGTAKEGK